jgi:hypothetical protein
MTDREARELAIQCKATGQGLNGMMRKRPELFTHIRQEKFGKKSAGQWVPVAEKLAKENGGTLQCGHWLDNNGYSRLYRAMLRYPELFAHIKQENKAGKNAEEWVPIAEKLAKENGGTLQNAKWLKNNGYSGLDRAMKRHPELFAHIKQEQEGGIDGNEIIHRIRGEGLGRREQVQGSLRIGLRCLQ